MSETTADPRSDQGRPASLTDRPDRPDRSGVRVVINPHARREVPAAGFAPQSREPMAVHSALPGYAPTPLHDCPELARALGVATVLVKDESTRLGLPSFKILGASYATLDAIRREWLPEFTVVPTVPAARAALAGREGLGLAAATDGNHGRGVARMAALLDLSCRILVPAGTADARIDAIAAEGARVEVVDGTYDDAVAASALLADERTLIVSDTSWPGYEATPRAVVQGYSTMFAEIDDQLAALGAPGPTVVALQAGVGAFAAAGLRHYRAPRRSDDTPRTTGASPARTVIVEPTTANCLMVSAEAGTMTAAPGPHSSSMAGLNCGLPSELVWPIVAAGTDVFVAVDDRWAEEAMRRYAAVGIEAGESGAASLGGLLAVAGAPAWAAAAGLTPDARVLLVNTEGATDPVNYRAVLAAAADGTLSASTNLGAVTGSATSAAGESAGAR